MLRPSSRPDSRPSSRPISTISSFLVVLVLAALVALAGAAAVPAQDMPTVSIGSFDKPSFGHTTASLIEANEFDKKHGIDIQWAFKKPRAANTDFATGRDRITIASALLSEANRRLKGVKSVYLFNVLNGHGALLTMDPAINSIADLEGKSLGAVTVTTNYAMFRYFAHKAGVDLDKVAIQSTNTAGLASLLMAKRADAVHIWEPNYSKMLVSNPGKLKMIEYFHQWQAIHGVPQRGFLGISAHEDWIASHKELIPKIYAAFEELARWLPTHHEEAATIIENAAGVPKHAFLMALATARYPLDVVPAAEIENNIKALFQAGIESGYMKKLPDDGIIYRGKVR